MPQPSSALGGRDALANEHIHDCARAQTCLAHGDDPVGRLSRDRGTATRATLLAQDRELLGLALADAPLLEARGHRQRAENSA